MPDVTWSGPATADLDRIAEWLDENRGEAVAAQMLEDIGRRADFLVDFPHAGRPHRGDNRILVVFGTPFLIIYRVSGRAAEIVRVHHERENWLVDP